MSRDPPTVPTLRRAVRLPGAVLLGLGSIVGTGVFVSIGLGAGIAGPAVIAAIALAGGLALCNALSSAQLAARHPVSGGTYEYGHRLLSPAAGFAAGWMFLCAKSASAATAALGCAAYALELIGADADRWRAPAAVALSAAIVGVVLAGLRRSAQVNAAIVAITLTALAALVLVGAPVVLRAGAAPFRPFLPDGATARGGAHLLHATALMFVAYTGYGRLATLGEEVDDPARTIPRAIVATLAISALLYGAVAIVAVGVLGAPALARATADGAAPLETTAAALGRPGLRALVVLGAVTAMLGVLLNLVLGLSRVVLAMGRRGDLPAATARLNAARTTPTAAVLVVGAAIAALAAFGSVRATWSFSAFTVLLYYAITNAAALRLPRAERRYHPAFAWVGLIGCLGLSCWVEPRSWGAGLALLALGLVWHAWRRRRRSRFPVPDTGA